MSELSFYPTINTNTHTLVANVNYTTAHNASSGNLTTGLLMGQKLEINTYTIYRGGLAFDTSGLDDTALIKSVTFRLRCKGGDSTLSGNILIKDGQPTYPHVPLEDGDYDISDYSGNGGTVDCTGILDETYVSMSFNSTGLSWINKTGYTKFLIVSQNDNISEPPTGLEYFQAYTYESGATYYPKLTIEYYIPSGIPVVGDPTYSNTKATYTKVTANISDAGGGYTERGFEYGISETSTWAVRETGVWGATGDYSLVLPDLLPLTTYYARAYVTNDYGTGYSDWTSFTTTDVPAYGMYEEDNTAVINFYVRKVGGKWSIKHGPYTTDQSDIEITKIITEGKGKYQIKFESDVLTGISTGVMCKVDIKAR